MADAEGWGVARGYHDATGNWREVPEAVVREVLASMGADTDAEPPPPSRPIMALPDSADLPAGVLRFEDGASIDIAEGGPQPTLPLGYHTLVAPDGRTRRVIVSPRRCPAPARPRQWGWAAQLYATRSRHSWGIGDLGDLAALGHWSASMGAGLILINPLHAASSVGAQEPSPYFASSRCFANPIYLRIEDLPGAGALPDLDSLAHQGRALNQERLVDRDRVWALKSQALEALFERFGTDPDFERYRHQTGPTLEGYALWSALAERHNVPWQTWPAALRHPTGAAVAAFAASAQGRLRTRYHAWLQWHLDRQRAAVQQSIGVVQDLAIGVNAGGADAWLWQDQVAPGIRVGAPADEFNTLGQDWGLPPWDPRKLAAADYEPFIQTIRGGLRHAGGLRVDHVMGLFRLYWIPEGRTGAEGTFVRYPHRDLLDIVALEATRAGAYVVGEDLGTVEPWVRDELRDSGVLSYRLWWFESDRPSTWPVQALGAVTTHDLPTVAGAWTGSDLEAQHRLQLQPNQEGAAAMRDRLAEWTGLPLSAPVDEVVERTYRALAEAPCALLTASLDDLCGVEERPNFPGTTDQWPNWSLALPLSVEQLTELPLARQVAHDLAREDGPPGAPGS